MKTRKQKNEIKLKLKADCDSRQTEIDGVGDDDD